MKTVIVHYQAFQSDQMFLFDHPYINNNNSLTDDEILEFTFRQCNHVDDTEWIAGKKLRSMSVGDVVIIIDGSVIERYRCGGIGWEIIANKR